MESRIKEFLSLAERSIKSGEPETFWSLRENFDSILTKEVWVEFMDEYASAISDCGIDYGDSRITVCDSDKFSLRLAAKSLLASDGWGAKDSLSFLTGNAPSMLSIVYPDEVRVESFSSSCDFSCDVFDNLVRFRKDGERLLHSWERVEVDSPRVNLKFPRSYDICIIEFSMKSSSRQVWEVCEETGVPLGAILIGKEEKAILSMLDEFKRIDFKSGEECVIRLTRHKDFNVRWAAVQCLNVINPSLVIDILMRFVDDPHPYISNAARLALSRVGESNG